MSGYGQMLNHSTPLEGFWWESGWRVDLWGPRAFINCTALPRVTFPDWNQHLRMSKGMNCGDYSCHLCPGLSMGFNRASGFINSKLGLIKLGKQCYWRHSFPPQVLHISWVNWFYFQFARCVLCRSETPSLVRRNKNLETTGKREILSCQSYF